ncbi:ADP-ribosylation factor-binding protein GGA1-like [Halichondria panicea]|uniref:ADP-ribosylation factor-binding protein GGA1-like n=1 Tax=Halichondria panicea TaxID=6063 RepID=UPI00312BBFB2
MDDSLQSLIDKATNPRNKYEDWEFIMSFCDKVNIELQGPQVALQLIVPKMRDTNEKVALLTLTLLEACVKNCGQRFHQEMGKFRFLNELIRMISPKYLGDVTAPMIKDKIKGLIFSWKLGLPNEPKIHEAYEMLKREGLVFDESVGLDPTLEQAQAKPKISLREDPKQAQMLQKLLASRNPDDLRAANRLIRDMVRRDDKRMQRLQKRLEELELIQNNIKLLTELLAHYSSQSGEHEKSLIKELYRSLDKMRPNLMRMASDLKNNEEGMADILAANEGLLRVTDTYKRIFESSDQAATNGMTETASGATSAPAPSTEGVNSTASGGVNSTSGAGDSGGDVLIDLAGLDFGPPPTPVIGGATQDANLSSLIDDFGLLDLPPIGTSQALPSNPPSRPNPAPMPNLTGPGNSYSSSQPSLLGSFAPPTFAPASQTTPIVPLLNPPPGGFPPGLTSFPPTFTSQATPPQQRIPPTQPTPPQLRAPTQPVQATPPQSTSDPFAGLGLLSTPVDPLAVLDNTFVPMETIQTGTLPPLQILNKDNMNVSFHFAKNSPSPGVSVIIISVLSTSPFPLSNFQFQAAVPKVMRVKLQPPSGTSLNAFNPIQPPSTISQIMLLANPSKVKVRMKFRVSYNRGGQEVVEMGDITDFPDNS